ncbi:hypothetical protein [Acinetobacter lwoffii]|jgi:hypothetical protein|uniref:hypothetical protein n=1 Tax=Acinetobacter lwoffii TaxID=28090 RepID=UPI001FF5479A|nr:hypothetical protein [Acinetobacter lwoffii]MCJ8512763.1 hypothetical protein [Acinetobacter lwoffii]MCO8084988.1 hypothetical protein [Acinetobacter lwoffii]
MAKQYKATQPVGRFQKGDVVGGLDDAQIQDLLQRGVIEEVKQSQKATVTTKTEKEVKADVKA